MKSTFSFILSILLKVAIVVVFLYAVMNVFGITWEDVENFFDIETKTSMLNVVSAEELQEVTETVCVFYNDSELVDVKRVSIGAEVTPPKVTKAGYTFKGWQCNGYLYSDKPIYATGSSMFFYSSFEAIEYTVTYYNADGELIGSYTATVNSDLTSIIPTELDGKIFLHWVNAFNLDEVITSDYFLASNLVLLPVYEEESKDFFYSPTLNGYGTSPCLSF